MELPLILFIAKCLRMNLFMRKTNLIALICLYIFNVNSGYTQIVADTFGITITSGGYNPPINNSVLVSGPTSIRNFFKFKPNELAAKGIVPGVTIYGIALHKNNSAALIPGAIGTLDLKMRSGAMDTALSASWSTYSVNYFYNNYLGGGFATFTQYSVPNSLPFPSNPSWIPMMLDAPFVYTGGCLDYWSDWESPLTQPLTSLATYSAQNISSGISIISMASTGLIVSAGRPTAVIYHSTNPSPCNGTPIGGNVTGNSMVCPNTDFTLFLFNPSAGPGISYQWQSSNLSPVSWSNISGATNPSYTTSTASPKMYRCNVTCTNSAITTPSTSFTVNPVAFHIDSISKNIAADSVTFTPNTNLPISNPNYAVWHFGNGDTAVGYPVTYHYTTDGTYTVQLVAAGDCGYDTAYTTVTIGCTGSPSFQNVISANDNQICPGQSVTLSMNNNPPANYSLQWQYMGSFGVFYPITGATGTTVNVSPAGNTIYRNKATCNISGNFKLSNEDTVYVTPAPVVTGIQAINTSGNNWQFNATGVQNAQTYLWDFGDGNTSNAVSPSHHYPNAGNYTVTLIVTNTTNGCTDTVTATVNVVTGIDETEKTTGLRIYPNPASSTITVAYQEPGRLEIMDVTGRVQQIIILPAGQKTVSADVSALAPGIYTYKLLVGQQMQGIGKFSIIR